MNGSGKSAMTEGSSTEANPEHKDLTQDEVQEDNGLIATRPPIGTPAPSAADGKSLDANLDIFSSSGGTGQPPRSYDRCVEPTDWVTSTSQPPLKCIAANIPPRCARQTPQSSADTHSLHSPFIFQKSDHNYLRTNTLPSNSNDEQQSDVHSPSTIQSTDSSAPLSRSRTASNSAPSVANSVTSAETSHSFAPEFLLTLKQRQDIAGRRRNPKLVRVSNLNDPHYSPSEIGSQHSFTSTPPFAKAFGKRAVGRSTLPTHITQSVLSASSTCSSSRRSERAGRTNPSAVPPTSCLISPASNQPRRPQSSKVSFASHIPPLPKFPDVSPLSISQRSLPIDILIKPECADNFKNASAPASVQNHSKPSDLMEDSTADLAPLSDACPFLSGPSHLRDRLERTAPYCNGDVKIEQLLQERGVDPGQVSRRDWTLVWHLSMTEASKNDKPEGIYTAPLMLPTFFFWLRSATEMERVQLTVDDFIKWV